jgi:hypothetical protein
MSYFNTFCAAFVENPLIFPDTHRYATALPLIINLSLMDYDLI